MGERTIKGNKNVLQSYKFIMARYDLSLTEKRILYRIIEIASYSIEKSKPDLKKGCYKLPLTTIVPISSDILPGCNVTVSSNQDITIQMDIRNILPPGYTNYSEAAKAFKSLLSKKIEIEDDSKWAMYNFLGYASIRKGSGIVEFQILRDVWEILLDLSMGYRKYELLTAFNLKSVYSMRLYEIVSKNKREITISINDLRKMLCLEYKYPNVNDLLKRTLEVAKKELSEKCPYTFDYETKKGKYGKIEAVIIIPVYIRENNDTNVIRKSLESKIDIARDLSDELYRFLIRNCHFSNKELKQHRELWTNVSNKIKDPINKLHDLWIKSNENGITNPKGYFIASVNNFLVSETHPK